MARPPLRTAHFKDTILDNLAQLANVAQFVSFAPGSEPRIRHVQMTAIDGLELNSIEEAVEALMRRSVERSVNVRSFHPEQPKAHEFVYGLTGLEAVVTNVRRLAGQGLYTIVNETVDVNDGGVSGVPYAGIL